MKKEDSVTLSSREQRRLMVLNQLGSGALVNSEAAALLGLSIRQVRRLRGQYGRRGAAALSHGNRGRRHRDRRRSDGDARRGNGYRSRLDFAPG